MSFIEILLEAKRKDKPKKTEKEELDVDVEKSDKENKTDNSDESPDIDEPDDEEDEVTDYSEEEFEVDAEEGEGDNESDDTTSDDTEIDDDLGIPDDEEDESTDYSDASQTDDGESDSENTEDSSSDSEQENNEEETGRDLKLLTDFSNLYQMIVETLNKLNNTRTVNLITKQVITQVSKNLSNTRDMLYDYIVLDYKKSTYAQRLKQYAFFIEALKINVSMLKKVGTSFSLGKTK